MQSYADYVNSLKELRFYVDIFSRRLQGESIPDEMIYTPGQDPRKAARSLHLATQI